jgi:fibronectin-binding autotransporter adhesin
MNKNLTLCFAAATLLATSSMASRAAVFFSDNFSGASTLNQPPVAPTASSASYQTYIGITNANSTSILNPGRLTFVYPNTSGVLGDCLARFSATPVTLSEIGDYIEIKIVFANASNILSTAAGTTLNANATLNLGLFNSSGVNPNQGQFALGSGSTFSGGTEDWLGYIGRIFYSGNSSIITRPAQTPNGTTSQNQDLLFSGASGSQAFNNPAGASLGSTAGVVSLVQGSTNIAYMRITLSAASTLTISNALFVGATISGAPTFAQEKNATGGNLLTLGFDGFAIGWRNNSSPAQGSAMDILGVEVSGISTVVTTPPDIITQPVPVTIATGGAGAFNVVAQGFNMTYQWHRYGTNLLNGGNISGATADTLIITNAGAADVASGANGYYVTITGTGGYSTNSVTNSLTLGTAKNLVWAGTGSAWDVNTSQNWLDGGNPAFFNYGDAVTFDDTASAGLTVINLTGSFLSASTVTVDGNTPYTFAAASTGRFAGPGKLVYKGANSLVIANANTYTGGTIISNPTAYLVLQNYGGIGSGPVTLAKAGGFMQVIPSGSASSGIAGDVNVEDDFTIQFDGTGSFAGVLLGNLNGDAGKTLTLNQLSPSTTNRYRVYGTSSIMDANLVLNGNSSAYAVVDGTVLAPYNPSGVQFYNGVISGTGGVIQRGNGTAVFSGQNTYTGGTVPSTGTIGFGADSTPTSGTVTSGPIGTGALLLAPELPNVTGSGTVLAWGGARTIANPIQYPSATNNQTLIVGGTNAITFSGPFTLNGNDATGTQTNRIIQVNNTALSTISGTISGPGFDLTKTGTGILALTGNNTYDGRTSISNGTLQVNGTVAGSVLVVANSTLAGTGTISGATTVLTNGILAPGNSIGTLTINNNLTLAGNMNVEVNRSGLASDKAIVSGTLANTGVGTIIVTNLGAALQAGDTFALFNKAVTGGNTMSVTGGGVIWTNKLAVDGTIAVVTPIATTPGPISYSSSGNTLTLSWPQNYLSWTLQSNIVGVASSASWFPVPNSGSATQFVVTINPARSNVFYRLIAP